MSFVFELQNINLNDPKLGVMNFLNEIVNRYPNSISFAPGRPLEKNFDVEKSLRYIDRFVQSSYSGNRRNEGYAALGQYGNTKGIIGEIISRLIYEDEHISADPNSVVTTIGSQEGMCLCLIALASSPGDVVLVEDPAYVGIMGAAKLFGIEVIGVPTDENGIKLERLVSEVELLRERGKTPRLLYVSPDFSNPTGFTTSDERREQLLEVTRELNLMILEDHAYSYFYFNSPKRRCLKSLSRSEHVIYLGSFSKSIYPGIRTGFLVADQDVSGGNGTCRILADELSKIKSYLTVNTSPINQAIVGGLIVDHNYSLISFTERSRLELKRNRDVMLDALSKCFSQSDFQGLDIVWNVPAGGFFITLVLPFEVSDKELNSCAVNYSVIWTPMSYFFVGCVSSRSIRLSYSYVTEYEIIEGIFRLSQFVNEHYKNVAGTLNKRR